MDTIEDLMPQTPDLNAARVEKLKELFPDLFTDEGKLSENELRKLLDPQSVNETERYEFRWFGKSKAKRDAFTPSRATLAFDEARSCNPEQSENLIIEGENLEVLKLLLCAYREQIKCIYIDPPYNTGKDFVYSDNYTEGRKPYWEQTGVTQAGVKVDTNAETHGRFHSNWMNMMYSRLLVARQLLKPDGVIFISIDDNEVHNLRRICEEVFGEENFIADIIWHGKYTTSNDAKYISYQHEHLLFFAKNKESFEIGLLDRTKEMDKAYTNPDDERGVWKATPLHAKSGNSNYEFTFPNGVKWTAPQGRYPRYSLNTLKELYANNRIYFGKNGKSTPSVKSFLTEVKQGKTVGSVWTFKDVGSTHQANEQLADLFGKGIFDNPKSKELIKQCLKVANGEDVLTLDFFAGSGSTGQAVMELNEADGRNRKFILVQLPEKINEKSEAHKAGYHKISDITIERNKRVVASLIAQRETTTPLIFDKPNGISGLGFKVFRLEKSYFPRTDWSPDPEATDKENVRSLKQYIADKEAQLNLAFDRDKLLTEILLKEEGFKLNYRIKPYKAVTSNEILRATDGDKQALVCLDPTLELETVEHFKTRTESKFICLERALDTTKKWNLNHFLGEKFKAF